MARQKEFDRDAVLEKAMRLFWQKGYEATSIQDLVDHMGINRGSLYDTFGDKHRLYLEALDHYQQGAGSAATFGCIEACASPLAAIRQLFANLVEAAVSDDDRSGCFAVNASVELAARDQELAERAELSITNMEQQFLAILQQAQAKGELHGAHDLRALARFLVNGVIGIRAMAKMKPERALLEDVVKTTLSILT